MSNLFGNHIVGFPTRRLICFYRKCSNSGYITSFSSQIKQLICEDNQGDNAAHCLSGKSYGPLKLMTVVDCQQLVTKFS